MGELGQPLDLIFLDIDMPGENGVALAMRLQASQAHADIPVVFVTAHLDLCATMRKADFSAVEVITKPFRREDILDTLRRYCRQNLVESTG